MSSIRHMGPMDLLKFNRCNLDHLTETYGIDFYMNYFKDWPDLCLITENTQGEVDGYILGKTESSHYQAPIQPYDPQDPFYNSRSSPGQNYLPFHAHITCLTISPLSRRCGHARTLTSALERYGDEADAWFVDLFVRTGNEAARALYKNMGYTIWRTVVGYYGDKEDAWDMRRSLKRDVKGATVRKNGKDARVSPGDVW